MYRQSACVTGTTCTSPVCHCSVAHQQLFHFRFTEFTESNTSWFFFCVIWEKDPACGQLRNTNNIGTNWSKVNTMWHDVALGLLPPSSHELLGQILTFSPVTLTEVSQLIELNGIFSLKYGKNTIAWYWIYVQRLCLHWLTATQSA